jgi:hypothetical protein
MVTNDGKALTIGCLSFANRDVVYAYPVIVGIMMCHIFVDIVWENWGFRILHISMSLSYHLVVFETSVPHGETSGERVLHLARSIFPELRYDYPNVSPSLLTKIKRTLKKKANKTDQEINQSAQDL